MVRRPVISGGSLRFLAAAAALSFAVLAMAPVARANLPVDLALILAVDVSESVDRQEANQQRQGYVQAIQAEEVVEAILGGPRGRVAMTYVEWAGPNHLYVILDWAVIDSAQAAFRFANRLDRQEITQGYTTSITSLMRRTPDIFASLAVPADRRVLDISGDGPNNDGGLVHRARDRLVDAGVTINGLPILNDRPAPSGYPSLEDLPAYFRNCVVGGAGAFQVAAEGFDAFATAIKRKLVFEIAALPPKREDRPRLLRLAAAETEYDCSIGEKQSRERIRNKFETTGDGEDESP